MAIVAGFDVHRRAITFDALDVETGEVSRGRIDATPAAVGAWVGRFEGEVEVAVEACRLAVRVRRQSALCRSSAGATSLRREPHSIGRG